MRTKWIGEGGGLAISRHPFSMDSVGKRRPFKSHFIIIFLEAKGHTRDKYSMHFFSESLHSSIVFVALYLSLNSVFAWTGGGVVM